MALIYVNFHCELSKSLIYDYTFNYDICYDIMFQTEKTIKYIHLYFTGYNRVGDKVEYNPDKHYRLMGPFDGSGFLLNKRFVGWSDTLTRDLNNVSLEYVVIDYMDGTSETINGAFIYNFEIPKQEQSIEAYHTPMNPILKVLLIIIIGLFILGLIGNIFF